MLKKIKRFLFGSPKVGSLTFEELRVCKITLSRVRYLAENDPDSLNAHVGICHNYMIQGDGSTIPPEIYETVKDWEHFSGVWIYPIKDFQDTKPWEGKALQYRLHLLDYWIGQCDTVIK